MFDNGYTRACIEYENKLSEPPMSEEELEEEYERKESYKEMEAERIMEERYLNE